jgi:hypothetical protein
MITPRIMACWVTVAVLCGVSQEMAAQNVPSGNGFGANNAGGNYGGNPGGNVPRVAVAPNVYAGIGGLRHVTIPTPTIQQQQIVRQHFIAGGMRLAGVRPNGANQIRGALLLGP